MLASQSWFFEIYVVAAMMVFDGSCDSGNFQWYGESVFGSLQWWRNKGRWMTIEARGEGKKGGHGRRWWLTKGWDVGGSYQRLKKKRKVIAPQTERKKKIRLYT